MVATIHNVLRIDFLRISCVPMYTDLQQDEQQATISDDKVSYVGMYVRI